MSITHIFVILGTCFSLIGASTDSLHGSITEIDSVREIKSKFGNDTVLIVDADETVTQVDCMPCNWEYGRQFATEMLETAKTFYQSKGHDNATEGDEIAAFQAFFDPIFEIFKSQPLSYSLTEEAWPEFLIAARSAGAQIVVVSSRRFKDEEPSRIKFFEDLGFKRDELLYARSKKDVTVSEWLKDKAHIKQVIFIDNLKKHCEEIMHSEFLASYSRYAFVHNAYKAYFMKHYKAFLPLQLEAALSGRRLTDLEVLGS